MQITNEIREFNRFYTNILGLVNNNILNSPFSLTEARVLYEIDNRTNCTATTLIEILNVDRGYLSRMIKRFENNGLVQKKKSCKDNRIYVLQLSEKGRNILSNLIEKSNNQINNMLDNLTMEQQQNLVLSMHNIIKILSNKTDIRNNIKIRTTKLGDISYIAYRHCILYKKEYGFDATFENYVLPSLTKYVENYNDSNSQVWVADYNGTVVGSIGIVGLNSETAQLRWFLIEPEFRNLGLGKKLITQVLEFCKGKYKHIYLWTISSLEPARHLYKSFGFNITEEKTHFIWGHNLTEERWDLFM